MAPTLKPRRARALLEQAELHRQRGEWEQATSLARQVAEESSLVEPAAFSILAEGYEKLGKVADAEAALRNGLLRKPSPELQAALGSLLTRGGKIKEGLSLLEKVKAKLGRNPGYLAQFGLALMQAGREDDAEAVLTNALTLGGGNDARLVMAALKGKRGDYAAADSLASGIEANETDPAILKGARAVRADARLFLGDAGGALTLWKALAAANELDPGQLGHMAYAAQLAGETELADQLIAQRLAHTATAEDHLLFAQVKVLRNQPEVALEHLDKSVGAPGEHFPGHDYELLATRGRALRLLGLTQEAKEILEEATALEEYGTSRLGPRVHVDLGHLAAEEGDFIEAEKHYRAALELDEDEPEAKQAMLLTSRKVAWKSSLEASAEARVEAANAEAEAMKRRFLSREGELEAMRRELQRLKSEHRAVSERAEQAEADAQAVAQKAAEEQRRKVREELEHRERDADAKTAENIERALAGLQAPVELLTMLRVAERTFQQALTSGLAAAGVAVFFSGALERWLFALYVTRFNAWLNETGRRHAFLEGAISERRGRRVEYYDHFVEAFDDDRAGRAPSLGEVGRVLLKSGESYLEPFRRFLAETYAAEPGFYPALGEFVIWANETLRNPLAHGRFVELGYDTLKTFRERLLFAFQKDTPGVLAMMLKPR